MYKSIIACSECHSEVKKVKGLGCPHCGFNSRYVQRRLYCYIKIVKVISKPNPDKKGWQFWKEDFIEEL